METNEIKCEFCNKLLSKSSLKSHQKSKTCIELRNYFETTDVEELFKKKSTEDLFLKEDIMKFIINIFLLSKDTPVYLSSGKRLIFYENGEKIYDKDAYILFSIIQKKLGTIISKTCDDLIREYSIKCKKDKDDEELWRIKMNITYNSEFTQEKFKKKLLDILPPNIATRNVLISMKE